MKLIKRFAGILLAVMLGCSVVACGTTEDVPEGSIGITFWFDGGMSDVNAYYSLCKAYNDTQGAEDGVYVTPKYMAGCSTSFQTQLSSPSAANVVMISDTIFRSYAMSDLFADLTQYYEKDVADGTGDYREENVPQQHADMFKLTLKSGEKSVAGEGQNILGLPFGDVPAVLYYNEEIFTAANINIVSCEEDALAETYPGLQPHGYAEYKTAPFDGAVSSTNLAGDTVYKVFNNCIPMNWEELRYLAKCFTKSHTNNTSSTDYGYIGQWWFSYGWSVGGDVMGYDGESYSFTLGDKSPNYLVTRDGTQVNGRTYAAGEVILYEDKVNEENIATMEGVYELPSQYEAIIEFLRLTNGTDATVDSGYKGYGVASNAADGHESDFINNEIAMSMLTLTNFNAFKRSMGDSVNIAPTTQYRKYVGGSVYYDGAESFENEYLKVIGETYDGTVYTGEPAEQDGTLLYGRHANSTGSICLVVPKASDSSKHEAAYKFIRWACGAEGQAYVAEMGTKVPMNSSVALSETYIKSDGGDTYNYYAFALQTQGSNVGDWGYFESGQWVSSWSNDFNNYVRVGDMKLSEFIEKHEDTSAADLNAMELVVTGVR